MHGKPPIGTCHKQHSIKNGGPIAGAAVYDDCRLVVYADFFNRQAATPKRPEPRRRRRRESGSGTAVDAVPVISTRSEVGLALAPLLFTKKVRVFTPPLKPLLIEKGELNFVKFPSVVSPSGAPLRNIFPPLLSVVQFPVTTAVLGLNPVKSKVVCQK